MSFGTLGLSGVVAVSEEINQEHQELRLTLRQVQLLRPCVHCGRPAYWHDRRDLTMVSDTPAAGLKVKLEIQRRRARCSVKACGKVADLTTPFVHGDFRVTERLYRFMGTQFRDPGLRFDRLAAMVGFSDNTARSVFIDLAEQMEASRERRVILGRVLRIVRLEMGKRSRYLLVNVSERALADITSDADPEQLRAVLTKWGAAAAPLFVWIPDDHYIRTVVRDVFPGVKLALTRHALTEAAAKAADDIRALKGKVLRSQAAANATEIFDILVGRMVPEGESVREKLRRLGRESPLPWLTEWVHTWEAEVVAGLHLPGVQTGSQDPTVALVDRTATQLILSGYGYSFNVLRQRLMYCLEPVWAYEEKPENISFMTGIPSLEPQYTTKPSGPRVGEFGVPLNAVLTAVERAVQAGPPDLEESSGENGR